MKSFEKALYNNVRNYHAMSDDPGLIILEKTSVRPDPKRYPDDNIITSTLQCLKLISRIPLRSS